jgi:sialate O-acetylesterase
MKTDLKIAIQFIILFIFQTTFGQIRNPMLISDGMVLQRDTEIKIWGNAKAKEEVKLTFNNKSYAVKSDANGNWEVMIDKTKAGGPFEMEINEGSDSKIIKDILVGDVWVCSGQSNMEYPMERLKYIYADEIAKAKNPYIRQFSVPQKYNFKKPQEDLAYGNWKSADPQSVLTFSGVGYFFAKDLYEKYKVPIGLINASLGGAPAESLMSKEALKDFLEYLQTAEKFKDDKYIEEIENKNKTQNNEWYEKLHQLDKGLAERWFDVNYVPKDWLTMDVPGYWADGELGNVNGAVWFRKKIDVPASMTGKEAMLELGRMVDADTVYINGQFGGTTSYQYPRRNYVLPANMLKAGKNIIVIRIINNSGRGGFVPDKPYQITAAGEKIDLKGKWQYKLGAKMEAQPGEIFIRWKPTGLYNAMIAPLLNYKIKGVIFYQGESNTGRPGEYQKLFSNLITDWREKWNEGDFPFLYVQLPNFGPVQGQPSEGNWALVREAQLKTLSLPNTAMIVAIDLGEWNDLHPLNKKDVGKRLALAAENVAYREGEVIYSGPVYGFTKKKNNKIEIYFKNIGGGLVAKGGELKNFTISGEDKKFVWANAKINGKIVEVWSEQITNPVYVRYAWADNPAGNNLYNREGFPASPFRTDE